MEFVDKKLSEITPYKNNPRNNDEAVGPVAESIKEFGFKVPIVIDKNGEIVNGHTRYKAAKKLGLETVPVIVADDLSEEQIKAFRLADNKVGEIAAWDLDLLNEELNDILDLDMSAFGFDVLDNLDDLIEDEKDLDDFTETVPDEPKSKLGDIYQLGSHKLMCGDSTNGADVKNL
ncbi:ParB N-terminal domain-containing protein [Streptococcus dysgalactiae]|uniref:ParB N-terminal domain-containing protein n=1 Tax=Streptococcus dysgalactiae TaxID=1334 RepID=UPI003531B327